MDVRSLQRDLSCLFLDLDCGSVPEAEVRVVRSGLGTLLEWEILGVGWDWGLAPPLEWPRDQVWGVPDMLLSTVR